MQFPKIEKKSVGRPRKPEVAIPVFQKGATGAAFIANDRLSAANAMKEAEAVVAATQAKKKQLFVAALLALAGGLSLDESRLPSGNLRRRAIA